MNSLPHGTLPCAAIEPVRPVFWLCVAMLALLAPASHAQDASDVLDLRELGNAYAHLLSFAAEPEISATTFDIESDSDFDNTMNVLKVPLYSEIEIENQDWNVFVQGALTSFKYTEEGPIDLDIGPTGASSAEFEWRAYAGIGEVGIVLPIAYGFSFAPSIGLGGTRYRNESEFSNPLVEDLLAPFLEGSVINWESSAIIGRGNLGLLYNRTFDGLKVKGSSHFVYSYVESFNESRGFQGFNAHNGSFSIKLDLAQPLAWKIGDSPLYVIGHGAFTSFVGEGRDDLGFSHFYELGISLGYKQVAIGLQSVIGPEVDGLSLNLNYGF